MSPKVLDLAEQRFGMLTALSRLPVKEDGYFLWDCLCSCGGRTQVSTKKLMRGGATNCGCIPKKTAANGPVSEDITGRRFGLLTAVSREESKGGKTRWLCSCDCGETKIAFTSMLKSGQTWHCGCEAEKTRRSTKLDLQYRRFGRLVAVGQTDKRTSKGSVIWKCVCDCGNTVEVSAEGLVHGNTVSCGCRKQEIKDSFGSYLTFVEGTCIEWLRSRKHRCDNTSGFRGVYKEKNKWRVFIGLKKKRYYIGTFNSFEEAREARLEVEKKLHDDFVLAWDKWKRIADKDPVWRIQNPFIFEVSKIDGELITYVPILSEPAFSGF